MPIIASYASKEQAVQSYHTTYLVPEYYKDEKQAVGSYHNWQNGAEGEKP
jgi:hypothetical protein